MVSTPDFDSQVDLSDIHLPDTDEAALNTYDNPADDPDSDMLPDRDYGTFADGIEDPGESGENAAEAADTFDSITKRLELAGHLGALTSNGLDNELAVTAETHASTAAEPDNTPDLPTDTGGGNTNEPPIDTPPAPPSEAGPPEEGPRRWEAGTTRPALIKTIAILRENGHSDVVDAFLATRPTLQAHLNNLTDLDLSPSDISEMSKTEGPYVNTAYVSQLSTRAVDGLLAVAPEDIRDLLPRPTGSLLRTERPDVPPETAEIIEAAKLSGMTIADLVSVVGGSYSNFSRFLNGLQSLNSMSLITIKAAVGLDSPITWRDTTMQTVPRPGSSDIRRVLHDVLSVEPTPEAYHTFYTVTDGIVRQTISGTRTGDIEPETLVAATHRAMIEQPFQHDRPMPIGSNPEDAPDVLRQRLEAYIKHMVRTSLRQGITPEDVEAAQHIVPSKTLKDILTIPIDERLRGRFLNSDTTLELNPELLEACLTPREMQFVELRGQDISLENIGRILNVSPVTATHMTETARSKIEVTMLTPAGLYRLHEVSRITGIRKSTIEGRINRGVMSGTRILGHWYTKPQWVSPIQPRYQRSE